MGQRTSVSEGLSRQMLRMDEDFVRQYPGGTAKLELAKGHPNIKARTYALWDALAAEQERMLPLLEGGPRVTVQLGQFKTPDDLNAAMDAAGVKYYDKEYIQDLVRSIELTQTQGSAEGYPITPGEVGNTDWVQWDHFYPQTEAIGFGDVVQEFAALVALKCARQLQNGEPCDLEVGEWFIACSKPIMDSHGDLRLLYVERGGGGVCLGWSYGSPGHRVDPDYQCFRSRKRK